MAKVNLMSVDVTYFRIERLIKSGTECFLCALEDEVERKYIDAYLSELVMDSSAREKIVKSMGFCNNHFYKMLIAASKPESSDGHGVALITQNIIEKLIQDLHKQKKKRKEAFHQLERERNCPACAYLTNFIEIYNKKAAELLVSNHKEFLQLFKNSKGLCIPHFIALLDAVEEATPDESRKAIEAVVEVEEKNLRRLNSELSEYVKRQSYEFTDKDRSAVEDAVWRSVQKIVGRRK